jgi:osmotically-inducible protein OsmY
VNYKTDRPDYEIKPEIERVLESKVLVDDGLIDVAVEDGKVTLTGIVGSAAEKRNAWHSARVAGVRAVDVSGLEVKRWARDDDLRKNKYASKSEEEIRKAVKDAMLYDPRVFSFNVTPEVSGSFVTLRGTVDNLRAKRAAEMNARHTVGVSVVTNRLKVRPVNPPSDDTIEAYIAEALLRDPYVERYEITANVHDGTAYLYGTVDSFFEKDRADDLASRVNGVRDVKNRLVVDYDYYAPVYGPYVYGWHPYDDAWYDFAPANTSASDAEIKEEVEDQLWWSPFVDSEDITVSVHDSVVTLDGTVTNWTERVDAVKNAYDAGASRVKDDLVLSYSAD